MTPKHFSAATLAELDDIIADLRESHPDLLLLFRGQSSLHATIRSGRARPGTTIARAVEDTWTSIADFILDESYSEDPEWAKALLQHYGLPTHFVDLTSDPHVAAWFATHKYSESNSFFIGNSLRLVPKANYKQLNEGIGHIVILGIREAHKLIAKKMLFDLSALPESCARPRAQSGWLLYDHPPVKPEPNDFWLATIELDRNSYRASQSIVDLFPPPHRDRAYGRLLAAPFVHLPNYDDNSLTGSIRLLNVPEYSVEAGDLARHKWCDFSLYEPKPIRLWQGWHFELSTQHQGVSGDIADSTKIIVAPAAAATLRAAAATGYDLEWPALNSDNLFFSFAQADHDKVIDHGPPYDGVWLFRDHDIIIEHPMISDETKLTVTAGLGFRLRKGALEPVSIQGQCKCDEPESHLDRVRGVLALQYLLNHQQLTMAPHPGGVERCYVVFHPQYDLRDEALDMLKLRYPGRFE